MIVKLIPIDEVIAKIVDDLGLGDRDIPFESMVDWIYHALRSIGAYSQFDSKCTVLEVNDYRATLPVDFYRVDAAKFTYPHKVTHNSIEVDFRRGSLEIHYLYLPIDNRGYPFVPEDTDYIDALFWYVASRMAMRDELPNKKLTFEFCDAKWQRLSLSARGSANMGDIQFMQRRGNDFRKMRYNTNPLRNNFKGVGDQENLRR